MNQREKLLVGLIGALLIIGAVVYFGDMYMERRSLLISTAESLKSERSKQKIDFEYGIRSTEELTELEKRALPWDVEDAQRLYQAWLLDTLDNKVGFTTPDVATGVPKDEEAFMTHQFTVTCQGDVAKLTEFLYHFYSADFLHYFDNINIRQNRDSRDLTLSFAIRAMALPQAGNRESLSPGESEKLAAGDVDAYIQSIAYRNPFGFKNKQPKLSVSSSVSVTQGESLSLKPKATDPDEDDTIRYYADLEELAGARIDERTGSISWRSKELGDYQITVYAEDNGFPPSVSAADVKIRVVEPKKEVVEAKAPEFDTAKLAIVSAIVRSRGKPQVWVALRSEGRVLKLNEGDQFEVGQTNAVVKTIEQREFQFETKDGELRVVELGQNLAEAQAVSSGE